MAFACLLSAIEGAGMTEYRLYWRDGSGRILKAPDVITATGDAEAVERARALKACSCEVWQEARLVAVVDAERQAS